MRTENVEIGSVKMLVVLVTGAVVEQMQLALQAGNLFGVQLAKNAVVYLVIKQFFMPPNEHGKTEIKAYQGNETQGIFAVIKKPANQCCPNQKNAQPQYRNIVRFPAKGVLQSGKIELAFLKNWLRILVFGLVHAQSY